MNRIDAKFRELKRLETKAFIAYIAAGDPALDVTRRLVPALEGAGADIIELGIPFSDPLADGPTIQAASQRALEKKINLGRVFRLVRVLRKKTKIPLVFMTYYNPVLKYGPGRFIRDCAKNGVDGVIVPDLPFEESMDLVKLARSAGVATINLSAPTSTPKRIRALIHNSTGFIYYVSLTGVTGARKDLPEEIASKVRSMKRMTNKPICVGFGVSTPAQAGKLAKTADGVIVGSAIVRVIEKNLARDDLVKKVSNFAKKLSKAVHGT